MKLYRIQNQKRHWGIETRFATSLTKTKQIAKKMTGTSKTISECQIADRLTAQDWIDLLEMDSPGVQEGKTPVDFITSSKVIWTKECKA